VAPMPSGRGSSEEGSSERGSRRHRNRRATIQLPDRSLTGVTCVNSDRDAQHDVQQDDANPSSCSASSAYGNRLAIFQEPEQGDVGYSSNGTASASSSAANVPPVGGGATSNGYYHPGAGSSTAPQFGLAESAVVDGSSYTEGGIPATQGRFYPCGSVTMCDNPCLPVSRAKG